MAAKQYDNALKAYSTAARADGRSAAAWKGLGTVYYYKHDYASASKYYKYSYQLNPADTALGAYITKLEAAASQPAAGSPTDLAARYYQAKRYPQPIQSYNTALASNPHDPKAWQGLGNCYYAQQNKPQAVDAYKHALQLNPSNTALQNFLASYAPESAGGGAVAEGGPKDWVQPLWRSAVLPGWGQGYNGQNTKGWLLGGTTIALLGGTVVTYIIGDGARTKYMSLTSASDDYDTPYNTWESMANLNHIFYIGFGLAYTFTLIDAIMGAKRLPKHRPSLFEEKPAQALQLGMVVSDALGIPGPEVQAHAFLNAPGCIAEKPSPREGFFFCCTCPCKGILNWKSRLSLRRIQPVVWGNHPN